MTLRHDAEEPYEWPLSSQRSSEELERHRRRCLQHAGWFWIECDLCGSSSRPYVEPREALCSAWGQGFVVATTALSSTLTGGVKEALEARLPVCRGPYQDPLGPWTRRSVLYHLCALCAASLTPPPPPPPPVTVRGTVAVTASQDLLANLVMAVRAACPQAVEARRLRDLEHLVRLVATDTPPPEGTAERLGALLAELLRSVPTPP